jgi:hypothetical protein
VTCRTAEHYSKFVIHFQQHGRPPDLRRLDCGRDGGIPEETDNQRRSLSAPAFH